MTDTTLQDLHEQANARYWQARIKKLEALTADLEQETATISKKQRGSWLGKGLTAAAIAALLWLGWQQQGMRQQVADFAAQQVQQLPTSVGLSWGNQDVTPEPTTQPSATPTTEAAQIATPVPTAGVSASIPVAPSATTAQQQIAPPSPPEPRVENWIPPVNVPAVAPPPPAPAPTEPPQEAAGPTPTTEPMGEPVQPDAPAQAVNANGEPQIDWVAEAAKQEAIQKAQELAKALQQKGFRP